MYTYNIEIQDGNFVTPNGPTQALQVGDWQCKIENRKLTCIRKQDKNILKYVILKNGLSRLTLQLPHGSKTLKTFWLTKPKQFKLNGILHLPADNARGIDPKFFIR